MLPPSSDEQSWQSGELISTVVVGDEGLVVVGGVVVGGVVVGGDDPTPPPVYLLSDPSVGSGELGSAGLQVEVELKVSSQAAVVVSDVVVDPTEAHASVTEHDVL